jgi:hypothetical protein
MSLEHPLVGKLKREELSYRALKVFRDLLDKLMFK